MPRFTYEGQLSVETTPRVMSLPAGVLLEQRFAALDLLGRGGMAEVYRVRDESTGREIAFKRLRRDPQVPEALARTLFEREYYTLAQLRHPCIIEVHDYGIGDDGPYYTMELLDGFDLRKQGKLPWQKAAEVLSDVASALAMLHSRRWLHRDVSPRNVVLTKSGIAKLIDFGAMAPMGTVRNVVGTPPFVAPEALQQQDLDARADLFALGALAYRILTGRHAYPARTFNELRDRWRSTPRPPDKLIEVPAPFSALVLELLSLDRSARPATAAEVIDRLGLSAGPRAARHIARADWLASPKLCGRDQALGAARKQLVQAMRGRGSGLLIEGDAGAGRSRFLDACVLEAKLLGPVVLRADASDSADGEYGVAAALGAQLLAALPDVARTAARLRQSLLATVLPDLLRDTAPLEIGKSVLGSSPPASPDAPSAPPERRHLLAALRDWFRAVARRKRLIVAVDDIERIDEPSAALLASLVHRSDRRKLIIIATARRDAVQSPAIDLLRQAAARIELLPLDSPATEAMLQSVFGNAARLPAVAERIYEISEGNPRLVMELAQHLVSSGRARYESGSWTLPEQLGADDLPASIDASLKARVSGLSDDARELLRLFCLTDPLLIALEEYPKLRDDADRGRTFAALHELVHADVLRPQGSRHRFARQSFRQRLAERLESDERKPLHARLALLFKDCHDPLEFPYHLMHSGQEAEAIRLLLRRWQEGKFVPSRRLLDLVEYATSASETLHLSPTERLSLRIWLLGLSGGLCALDIFGRQAPIIMSELSRASGLSRLSTKNPSPAEVAAAMREAEAAHHALPESERTFAPTAAVRMLAGVTSTFCGVAWVTLDAHTLDSAPSLTPFVPISTAARIVQVMVEGARRSHAGAAYDGWASCAEVLKCLDEYPDALDAQILPRVRRGVLYALAGWDARSGTKDGCARAAELLDVPGYRGNAWQLRRIYHLLQGQTDEAHRCQRRAELLSLQDGSQELFPGTALIYLIYACGLCEDLHGLKQLVAESESIEKLVPNWHTVVQFANAEYLRIKGDLAAALALSLELLTSAQVGGHALGVAVATQYISILNALGKYQEARAKGLDLLACCREAGQRKTDHLELEIATAEALAFCGEVSTAIEVVSDAIGQLEQDGVVGVRLGALYETRARIAIAMGDNDGFDQWAERSANLYLKFDSGTLAAKHGRLLQQARSAGLHASEAPPLKDYIGTDLEEPELTDYSRMDECIDARERAACALTLVLEQSDAIGGHLYGVIGGELRHLASVPEQTPPADLPRAIAHVLQAELAEADATAATAITGAGVPEAPSQTAAPFSQGLRPIILKLERNGEPVIAAVAAVSHKAATHSLAPALLASLASILLERNDVDPLTHAP